MTTALRINPSASVASHSMQKTLLPAAFMAAFLIAPHAHGQDEPTNHRGVISAQLDRAATHQATSGYAPEGAMDPQTVIGLLPKQNAVLLEISLRAGMQYFISAVCDADCADLDLRLHAPGIDKAIAEDVGDDDVPLLLFTATKTGPHMLTVRMADCKADLCYFGFRVMAKK